MNKILSRRYSDADWLSLLCGTKNFILHIVNITIAIRENTLDKAVVFCYNTRCGDSAFVESLSGRMRHRLKARLRRVVSAGTLCGGHN